VAITSVTPSLPQRGRQPKGGPLDPSGRKNRVHLLTIAHSMAERPTSAAVKHLWGTVLRLHSIHKFDYPSMIVIILHRMSELMRQRNNTGNSLCNC
jgi:hypothetical protein